MSYGGEGVEYDPHIGLEFGDHLITRKLAAGGMGMVYLAEVPSTRGGGVPVVVKFMLREYAQMPAVRARFDRECQVALRLHMDGDRLAPHPNIVQIKSWGERKGELYMVMEFLQGESLEEHLNRHGRISKYHAFRLMTQLARALHDLHAAGLVHRDLKPANVMIVKTRDEEYCVKLIDLGIVHDRHAAALGGRGQPKTQEGSAVGTPGYMAPEQISRPGSVTAAADVFAIAVILWEIFTRELPFGVAPNLFAQHERQMNDRPIVPLGSDMPEGWEPILRRALSPSPEDRPTMHELFFELAATDLPGDPVLHVKSGVEFLVHYASNLVGTAPPDLQTVRHKSAERPIDLYWQRMRSTLATGPRTPWCSEQIPVAMPARAPVGPSTATMNERPTPRGQEPVPNPTQPSTLSLSSGVRARSSQGTGSRSLRWIPIAIGTVAVVGTVFVAAIRFRGSSETGRNVTPSAARAPQETPRSPEPESAPLSAPATPAPVISTPAAPVERAPQAQVIDEKKEPAVSSPPVAVPPSGNKSTKRSTRPRNVTKHGDGRPPVTAPVDPNPAASAPVTSPARPSGIVDPNAIKE